MQVDPQALGFALKRVLHAAKAATDRHGYIWLDMGPREAFIRVVATDNYRIAVASIPFDHKADAVPMAIHRDDVTVLLYYLARAGSTMQVLPWEADKIAFKSPQAALILPNWQSSAPLPDWRKVADQQWDQNHFFNLGFVGDAGKAADTTGYLKIPADPKSQPIAFATHDYVEYIMPLRQDGGIPKDHEEYGVFKL